MLDTQIFLENGLHLVQNVQIKFKLKLHAKVLKRIQTLNLENGNYF